MKRGITAALAKLLAAALAPEHGVGRAPCAGTPRFSGRVQAAERAQGGRKKTAVRLAPHPNGHARAGA